MSFSRLTVLGVAIAMIVVLVANAAAQTLNLRTRWQYSLPASADAPVAATDGIVVSGDQKGNVTAVTPVDGKLIWQVKLGASISSGAAIAPDAVYIGDEEGTLHALAAADGKPLWQCKSNGKIIGTPLALGQNVLFGSYDNHVYCCDARSGNQLWMYTSGAQVHAGLVAFKGLIITGGCDGYMRALDPASGAEKWALELGAAIPTTPQVRNDRFVVCTMTGDVCAIDAAGKLLWRTAAQKDSCQITASPAIVGNRVVAISEDGRTAAFDLADGGKAVTAKIVGRPGGSLLASVAAALIGTDDGKIVALDPATAAPAGQLTLGGSVTGLAAVGEHIYAGTREGAIWMLSAK